MYVDSELGPVKLMILKMRDANQDDDSKLYKKLRRRVQACLITLTSISCLCEGKDTVAKVRKFIKDYSKIGEQLGFEMSKLQVFRVSRGLKASHDETLVKMRAEHSQLMDITYRGPS